MPFYPSCLENLFVFLTSVISVLLLLLSFTCPLGLCQIRDLARGLVLGLEHEWQNKDEVVQEFCWYFVNCFYSKQKYKFRIVHFVRFLCILQGFLQGHLVCRFCLKFSAAEVIMGVPSNSSACVMGEYKPQRWVMGLRLGKQVYTLWDYRGKLPVDHEDFMKGEKESEQSWYGSDMIIVSEKAQHGKK